MFLSWVIDGQYQNILQAQDIFQANEDYDFAYRLLALVPLLITVICCYQIVKTSSSIGLMRLIAYIVAIVTNVATTYFINFLRISFYTNILVLTVAYAFYIAGSKFSGLIAVISVLVLVCLIADSPAIAFVITVTIVVYEIYHRSKTRNYVFNTLGLVMLLTTQVIMFSPLWDGEEGVFLLLYIVLLVLINAPLDWVTLGFTRWCLWRGVQGRGWAPFFFGLIDVVFAFFLFIVLSVLIIGSTQLFDAMINFGIIRDFSRGNTFIIADPASIVAGIANPERRFDSEFWWVYFTLFSTLVPSCLNLLLAAGCFIRGFGWINQMIAQDLKEGVAGKPYLPTIQIKLASLLALQRILGLIFSLVVFFGTLWILLFALPPHVLPRLLEIAIPLAESDWAHILLLRLLNS